MATGLLVATPGSVALPVEYTFLYQLQEVMDRFIPSSKQPQHWSRNYNGSREERRRSNIRRGCSTESENTSTRSYRQGVMLRAEDLLKEQKLVPINFLSPRTDDRRAVLGGSATELTKCERPKAPMRRSSEGNYALRRKSSSSSSNAADDPTSSDPSSINSSSSSSESSCNGDSETCSYCRLTESSDTYECPDSTDDERSSSSSCENNRKKLTRARSEDCNLPSKGRPLRRTSPGEYLRYKRDQMEKLRNGQRHSPNRKLGNNFQRYGSDPRLHVRHSEKQKSPTIPTFVSPTRNRVRQSNHHHQKSHSSESSEEAMNQTILPVPKSPVESFVAAKSKYDSSSSSRTSHEISSRPKRSTQSKNVPERKSRSKERKRMSLVWNPSEETPQFVAASFKCSLCDCEIPFTNCVLCTAEAKGQYLGEMSQEKELLMQNSVVEVTLSDVPLLEQDVVQEEKKELEEFYDGPTPVNSPTLPPTKSPPLEKRTQWVSKDIQIHKSFNQEDLQNASSRRKSVQLRKHNSEPAPEVYQNSRSNSVKSQADSCQTSDDVSLPRSDSSCSSSSRKSGFHIAKDSPRKIPSKEVNSQSSCHTDETEVVKEQTKKNAKVRVLSPDVSIEEKPVRKSPVFLKPEFFFEPEIIHKANPLVDEAEVDVLPTAREAFRRLSTEEYLSTVSIHEAASKGDLHVVKLLIKKDSKQMETVDERGWTPIHLAAAGGHSEVVKYLASEGAHLSALDPTSYTALHLSAMNGHNSCLEVLLRIGVDVDSVTNEKFTPLHLAVMNNHLECIHTLLQWGANLKKRDLLNRGVYQMVEEYNLKEVAALLEDYNAELHNFKHVLDIMNKRKEEGKTPDIPQELRDILASIAEESGTE